MKINIQGIGPVNIPDGLTEEEIRRTVKKISGKHKLNKVWTADEVLAEMAENAHDEKYGIPSEYKLRVLFDHYRSQSNWERTSDYMSGFWKGIKEIPAAAGRAGVALTTDHWTKSAEGLSEGMAKGIREDFHMFLPNIGSGIASLVSTNEEGDFDRFKARMFRQRNMELEDINPTPTVRLVYGHWLRKMGYDDLAESFESDTSELNPDMELMGELGLQPTNFVPGSFAARMARLAKLDKAAGVAGKVVGKAAQVPYNAGRHTVEKLAELGRKTLEKSGIPIDSKVAKAMTATTLAAAGVNSPIAIKLATTAAGMKSAGVGLVDLGRGGIRSAGHKILENTLEAGARVSENALVAGTFRLANRIPGAAQAGRIGRGAVHGAAADTLIMSLAFDDWTMIGEEAGEGFFLGAAGAGRTIVGEKINPIRRQEMREEAVKNYLSGKSPEEAKAIVQAYKGDVGGMLQAASLEIFLRGAQAASGSDIDIIYMSQGEYTDNVGDHMANTRGVKILKEGRPVLLINADQAIEGTSLHEGMHGLLDLDQAATDSKGNSTGMLESPLRRAILGNFDERGNPEGGIYSREELADLERTYRGKLGVGDLLNAYEKSSSLERWDMIFEEIAAEYFRDLMKGRLPNKRQRLEAGTFKQVVNERLGFIARGLAAVGVDMSVDGEVLDRFGNPLTIDSPLFGQLKKSRQIDRIIIDYVNAKNQATKRFASDPGADKKIAVTMDDIAGSERRLEQAKGRLFKVDENGEILKDASGRPVAMTARERNKADKEANAKLAEILQDDDGETSTRLDEQALEELDQTPDGTISSFLKQIIRKVNESVVDDFGKPFRLNYYAALKGGKYSSNISMSTPLVTFLSISKTKAGNIVASTFEIEHYNRKIQKHNSTVNGRKTFALWNGDTHAFDADVRKLMENHRQGMPGKTDLDPNNRIANQKAQAIFTFLGVKDEGGFESGGGKFALVRQRRLDRISDISEVSGSSYAFQYGDMSRRFEQGEGPTARTGPEAISEGGERRHEPTGEATITVAPYRNAQADTVAGAEVAGQREPAREFGETIKQVIRDLGLSQVANAETVGGWFDTDVQGNIVEPGRSITIDNADPVTVRGFSALIGSLAPDVQQAVYLSEYDDDGPHQEVTIPFDSREDAEKASERLDDYDLGAGFTLDLEAATITIGVLDNEGTTKVAAFAKATGAHKVQTRGAHISFPGEGEYRAALQALRASGRGDPGEAWQRTNLAIDTAEARLDAREQERLEEKLAKEAAEAPSEPRDPDDESTADQRFEPGGEFAAGTIPRKSALGPLALGQKIKHALNAAAIGLLEGLRVTKSHTNITLGRSTRDGDPNYPAGVMGWAIEVGGVKYTVLNPHIVSDRGVPVRLSLSDAVYDNMLDKSTKYETIEEMTLEQLKEAINRKGDREGILKELSETDIKASNPHLTFPVAAGTTVIALGPKGVIGGPTGKLKSYNKDINLREMNMLMATSREQLSWKKGDPDVWVRLMMNPALLNGMIPITQDTDSSRPEFHDDLLFYEAEEVIMVSDMGKRKPGETNYAVMVKNPTFKDRTTQKTSEKLDEKFGVLPATIEEMKNLPEAEQIGIGLRYEPGDVDPLGMFSQAERVAQKLSQKKGQKTQMLAMLKKGGVTDEEITDTGLDKLLGSTLEDGAWVSIGDEGLGKITLAEIQEHLLVNQIVVTETVLGLKGFPDRSRTPGSLDEMTDLEIRFLAHDLGWDYEAVEKELLEETGGDDVSDDVTESARQYIEDDPGFDEKLHLSTPKPDVPGILHSAGVEIEGSTKFDEMEGGKYVVSGAEEGTQKEIILRLPPKEIPAEPRKLPTPERVSMESALHEDDWDPNISHVLSYDLGIVSNDDGGGDIPGYTYNPGQKRDEAQILVMKDGTYSIAIPGSQWNPIGTASKVMTGDLDSLESEILKALAPADPKIEETYKGHAFPGKNDVAWIRLNIRTIDGKRVLFIEEIQSDWHQKGRKYGYKGQGLTWKPSSGEPGKHLIAGEYRISQQDTGEFTLYYPETTGVFNDDNFTSLSEAKAAAEQDMNRLSDRFDELDDDIFIMRKETDQMDRQMYPRRDPWTGSSVSETGTSVSDKPLFELRRAREELNGKIEELIKEQRAIRSALRLAISDNAVAGDPSFKKSWPELAFKRMLKYAADNGLEGIGWTTGKTQSRRYDLSEYFTKIEWVTAKKRSANLSTFVEKHFPGEPPHGNEPRYSIIAHRRDTGDTITKTDLTAKELEEEIGKEHANKIVESVEEGAIDGLFEGLDLEVDDTALKRFYDEELRWLKILKRLKLSPRTEIINESDRGAAYQVVVDGKVVSTYGNIDDADHHLSGEAMDYNEMPFEGRVDVVFPGPQNFSNQVDLEPGGNTFQYLEAGHRPRHTPPLDGPIDLDTPGISFEVYNHDGDLVRTFKTDDVDVGSMPAEELAYDELRDIELDHADQNKFDGEIVEVSTAPRHELTIASKNSPDGDVIGDYASREEAEKGRDKWAEEQGVEYEAGVDAWLYLDEDMHHSHIEGFTATIAEEEAGTKVHYLDLPESTREKILDGLTRYEPGDAMPASDRAADLIESQNLTTLSAAHDYMTDDRGHGDDRLSEAAANLWEKTFAAPFHEGAIKDYVTQALVDSDHGLAYEEGNEVAGEAIVEEAAKEANMQSVYRGSPKLEDRPRPIDFGAVFLTRQRKNAEGYGGNVQRWFVSKADSLDSSSDEAKRLAEEHSRQTYNDQDWDDEWPEWYMFPDRKWVDFLRSKGYTSFYTESAEGFEADSDASDDIAILDWEHAIKSSDPFTFYEEGDPEVASGEAQVGDLIPISKRFDSTRDDTRFEPGDNAKKALIDSDHGLAYEEGNEEAGKAIADEAAKEAGFSTRKWGHATQSDFTTFDLDAPARNIATSPGDDRGLGVFLTDNKSMLRKFASDQSAAGYDSDYGNIDSMGPGKVGKVMPLYARLENPYVINKDSEGIDLDNEIDAVQLYFSEIEKAGGMEAYRKMLQDQGHDGVLLEDNTTNYYEEGSWDMAVVFDPSSVKSADPFTFYEEGDPEVASGEAQVGDLIPISKRFDSTRDDSRFEPGDDAKKAFIAGEEPPDFDDLNRQELKRYIKENELEVRVVKSMSDDDIREKIYNLEEEVEDGDSERADFQKRVDGHYEREMFHGTVSDSQFDDFELSQGFGVHLGTRSQADSRLGDKAMLDPRSYGASEETRKRLADEWEAHNAGKGPAPTVGRVFGVQVPEGLNLLRWADVHFDDVQEFFDMDNVRDKLGRAGFVSSTSLTDDQIKQLDQLTTMPDLRESLMGLGYDGITYENDFEGGGGDSIIIFDPSILRPSIGERFEPGDDAGYMAAVEADDVEAQQRLVNEAAKVAGLPLVGVNINDSSQDFTGQILAGTKTVETRNSENNALANLVGDRIGIVRTGKGAAEVVGYATVGEPIRYRTEKEFAADVNKHQVRGGKFGFAGFKIGYPLADVESVTPFSVPAAKGVVKTRPIHAPITRDAQGNVIPLSARFEPGDDMDMSATKVLYGESPDLSVPANNLSNSAVAKKVQAVAKAYWARVDRAAGREPSGQVVNSTNITAEQRKIIVENGIAEAVAALEEDGNAADWYTADVRAAISIMAVIHPELTDEKLAIDAGFPNSETAQLGMFIAMAITSQNLNVDLNSRFAEEQYGILSSSGTFDSTKIYGDKAQSISGNLELANKMVKALGWEGAKEFVSPKVPPFTVRDLEREASKILGEKITIAGRKNDEVEGAAIFGPKIGQGFLQNLLGNFDPVTIDLWLRRTWGRWTGDVLGESLTDKRLARILDAVRAAKRSGLKLPDHLKNVRPVTRTNEAGNEFRTISRAVQSQIENDEEFVALTMAWSKEVAARWQAEYRALRAPTKPQNVKDLVAGKTTLKKVAAENKKVAADVNDEYRKLDTFVRVGYKLKDHIKASLADRGHTALPGKKLMGDSDPLELRITPAQKALLKDGKLTIDAIRESQAELVKELTAEHAAFSKRKREGIKLVEFRDERLTELGFTDIIPAEIVSDKKPQWAYAATTLANSLKPIDIPSNQDRQVISEIIIAIRKGLEDLGHTLTNADVQAILWYPEKDLWSKLRGEGKSNLKTSYGTEFQKIAEALGRGKEAEEAAAKSRSS